MTKRALFAILTLLVALSAVAADLQPLTHETLWLMKRVGSPSVSPDGKWVVFSLTEPSYDSKEQVADLWIVPADGSAKPRRLTGNKGGESSPAWSPDSRRIAFAAKREGDEENQIYVLDLSGGEAQRITNLATGAASPKFSPDGRSLLFASNVFPGALDEEANKKAAKEEKDRKEKVRIYDNFPIRNWDRWRDNRQPHLFVQNLDGGAAKDLLAGTKLVAEVGFAGTGGGEGRESISGEWSPDGKWIVFGASTDRTSAAFAETTVALYRVAAAGGEPERIASKAGSYGGGEFSPDGKTLFATFNENSAKVYNLNRIVAFDWPSMTNERLITPPPNDRAVGDFSLSHDGKSIYFTAEDAGLVKLYSVPATGGTAKVVVDQERGVYGGLSLADDAPVMVATWGSSVDPAEIVRVDLTTRKHRNLTDFNVAKARTIDWQPPQHFWFTSKRGRKIHNMIVLPAGFDATKKYPLFVLMHGGPASMWSDSITLRWNYHLLAKPGYVMLLTNYSGSTGFGEEFAQFIQGDPLRGPAEEILEAADEAIKRYPYIDATRQVAGGASYGGHLASAMEAWSGTRFKALVNHAGLVNLESQWGTSDTIYSRELMNLGPVWEQGAVWREQNPVRYASQFKTPMLLSIGEKDFRVPLNNTLENFALLQRLRIPTRLLVWPEENHWILSGENSRVFYREVDQWLRRFVEPGPK
ncbi:MAG TPA: S9 family peptidase [Thermoanaerobaculia bacterium]